MGNTVLVIATVLAASAASEVLDPTARADEIGGRASSALPQDPRPRGDTTNYSVYYRGETGGWHHYSSTVNKRRAEDVALMLRGRGYRTYIDDGRQIGRSTPTPPRAPIPMPPAANGSSGPGNDPPGALRKVEPDVITGRDTGFRRTEPEVRSRPSRERLVMDPNAPKSQPRNGSIATPARQGKSRTRPVAPSSQPVRRPRPDAPTGSPGLNRRSVRPAPPSPPARRAQQKPRDAKRPSKSKKSQRRRSSPTYYPPVIPPFQGGHG